MSFERLEQALLCDAQILQALIFEGGGERFSCGREQLLLPGALDALRLLGDTSNHLLLGNELFLNIAEAERV